MTQPAYPQYGAPAQPGYPQYGPPQQPLPVAPGYPPQQYGQIPPPATPAIPLAQGSLDDFYGQPTVGGGQGLKFAILGTEYYVEQTRPITGADIQQQTDTRGLPQTFRDGRPKFQMLVPVTVLNSNVPDAIGATATFYVKGATREKLAAAMAAAGALAGASEAGCRMRLRYAADVPTGAGFNPRKDIDITYERPAHANSPEAVGNQLLAGQLITPAQEFTPQAAPVQQPLPAPVAAAPLAPMGAMPGPIPPAGVGPTPMPTAPAPAQAPPLPAPPAGPQLSPEQSQAYAALLAQMGQQPQG